MDLRVRLVVLPVLLLGLAVSGAGQTDRPAEGVPVFAVEPVEVVTWDTRVSALDAAGDLQRLSARSDSLAPGWVHERFQQRHRGLRVFGAQLIRHWQRGRVVSVNGRYYENIRVDTAAAIGPGEARLAAERAARGGARVVEGPELLIYPSERGMVLAYRLHVRTSENLFQFFVGANDGRVIQSWSDLHRQTAVVGRGTGTWEDTKKVSATLESGTYIARDGLRPAVSLTVDVMGNFDAWYRYQIDPDRAAAQDVDNEWTDAGVVDAHVYAGWTYDYFFRRFSRQGLDDSNITIISYIHFWPRRFGDSRLLNQAFWDPFNNSVNYGDGDGDVYNFFSGVLEIVAHELTHGVTNFTSELIYLNQSGALNEAFSDIMGIGAEFFFEPRGRGRQRSDWLVGEDVFIDNFGPNQRGIFIVRVPIDPLAIGDPDHFSLLFRGSEDNGGVHTNSLIATHTFYLFVEGGTNRTSGIAVEGIGFADIERAEKKIFYRAFTSFLIPSSDFSAARQATVQSAIDLYGATGNEVQQLRRAWDAVGVQ